MSAALKVPVTFSGRAQPILDALARMRRDVGSIQARLATPGSDAPPSVRLLTVALGDRDQLRPFQETLLRELEAASQLPWLHEMAMDIKLVPLPLDGSVPTDAVLVVFNQVAGVEELQ